LGAAKCLAAGFDEVVVLSLHRGTLGKVREAVECRVAEKDRGRLHFMSPEEFSRARRKLRWGVNLKNT
jgi:hypothetical protein